MQLLSESVDQLLAFGSTYEFNHYTVSPGSVLQTKDASSELILIRSGSCRILDPARHFNTSTVAKYESPYLCGYLPLIQAQIAEEVVASTSCEVSVLTTAVTDPSFLSLIQKLLRHNVSPSELPLLQEYVANDKLYVPNDLQSPLIYRRCWSVATNSDFDSLPPFDCVYADIPSQGFTHGQLTNSTALRKVWKGPTPRVLFWSQAQTVKAPQVISSSKSLSDNDVSILPDISLLQENQNDQLDAHNDISAYFSETNKNLSQRVRQAGFTPITGKSYDQLFEAVLMMIVRHFVMPTRRDTIKKASSFLLNSRGGPSVDKLVTVFDQIGLLARVVNCRSSEVSRLPTPSIVLDQDRKPVLIVEATSKGLLVVNPRHGVEILDSSELLPEDSEYLLVVAVTKSSSTPTARFGFGWMLPYIQVYKLGIIEVFIASFITQLFALATPLLFQQIIDRVIGQGSSGALGGFAALMALFMILELIFSSLRTFQFMEISNRVDINIGSSIISRLLRLNARYFEKRPVGELASRLNELDKIRSFLTGTALTVVLDAFFALLYFAIMFFYSPLLAGIILGSIPLLLIVILSLTPITQKLIRQRAEAHSRTHSYMVEVLNGIQTVKLQNSELAARRKWEDLHLVDINKGFKTILANTASSNALQLINKTTNILVICVGASLVLNNELTLGQLIAFRIISGYVTQPILRLASTWNNFQEVSMSIERLGDVVNQPLETTDLESANISMPPIRGEIFFDEVTFSYTSSSRPQLSGVSLRIPPGSFTGLVGQSGCGKSTMLKLVPRLYEPSLGKVLIDGYDVAKVELYSLRRQLGFVPQDCLLFEGTIYNNIAVADPEAEAEDVIQAAKLACAHEFIMTLPYGYNTPLGEKGSGLSGGQRQRVALARMLLQKPSLVILDEATSALDVDTEQQVVNNLRRTLKGTTVLMITHRLSTLINADQIVMMHEGRIDSLGTHDELMSKAGRYYALYQQQLVG